MPDPPRKGSLLVLFLTVFIDLLGFGIVLPLLPIYGKFFTGGDAARGWVIGLLMASFSAMQFLFAPVWGRLSDSIGRRPVLMIGLAGSVVFYTLFGLATVWQSLAWLFVARIGAGICGATISTAQAYIADTTPLEGRTKGMALIGAAFGLGFTFGPLVGSLAFWNEAQTPSAWPGYLAAGLSAFALLLAVVKLPESRRSDSRPTTHTWLDVAALRQAVAVPSIGLLLLASFVCVFSFGNFETTLSVLIKGESSTSSVGANAAATLGQFNFTFREVCFTFAFIGLILMIVQGGIVRRLSGRVPEGALAAGGAAVEVVGFGLMIQAIRLASTGLLFVALALVVSGFAFMTPSINSLISRRSDPAWQGGVMGLVQSTNSLARIVAPLVGLPLLHYGATLPFWLAAGMMAAGGGLVLAAAGRGADYAAEPAAQTPVAIGQADEL